MRHPRAALMTAGRCFGLAAGLLLLAAAPAHAFCVVNDSDRLLDIKAGGRIPVFYRGSVKPGERVCHIPKRLDVGIMVEIFQSGNVSGRDLKCRFSVPPKDATITVAQTCKVAVN